MSYTVYNEDCIRTMGRMLPDFIDLIVTSPPYYNAKDYSQYRDLDDYYSTLRNIFSGCLRVLKPSHMCIVNISPVIVPRKSRSHQSYRISLPFHFVALMEEIGFEFLDDIIWVKPDGSAPNRNGGFFTHRKPRAYKPNIVTEYIFVFKKPAPFLIDKVIYNNSLVEGEYERTNVWKMNPNTSSDHPAPYPEKLVENCVRYYSYENEVVYDPFSGSGTTGIVSTRLGRHYIGSEINEDFLRIFEKSFRKKWRSYIGTL